MFMHHRKFPGSLTGLVKEKFRSLIVVRLRLRHVIRLGVATAAIGAIGACGGGGGGGGNLAEESTEKSDAACECEDFDCTKDYIAWFNKVSITREDDLSALSTEDYDIYLGNSLQAGDCQEALR